MRVLALDPGPTESAYVVLDSVFTPAGGFTQRFGKLPNVEILKLCRTNAPFGCFFLAIEEIASFGMPVGADVFDTVWWSGRFCEAFDSSGFGGEFHRIKRHQVKMFLCQNMRAKDSNIRQALINKLGPPGTKKNQGPTYGISGDAWSALAVGVTFLETFKQSRDGQ